MFTGIQPIMLYQLSYSNTQIFLIQKIIGQYEFHESTCSHIRRKVKVGLLDHIVNVHYVHKNNMFMIIMDDDG